MTDAEREYARGWAAARKQMVDAVSMLKPAGEPQERYQRLVTAAINATTCPLGDELAGSKSDPYSAQWAALRARHPSEREPGEDDEP
jgi:hypothetical protein